MKKILSLVLVLCMMVFAVSALAEQTTETTDATAQQSAESGESLASLFAGSSESGEGEGDSTGALFEQIGATKAEEIKTVAAESAEQFFGTYTITKMIMMGYSFDVAALLAGEGESASASTFVLSAEGVTAANIDGQPMTQALESCELVDGVLNIVSEGSTMKLALTEDGNVLLSVAIDAENAISLLMTLTK